MTAETEPKWYNILTNGVELFLYVQPGAKGNAIMGLHAGKLKIRVSSPSQEGKANEALIHYLSSLCHIPKSSVHLIKGKTSRIKTVLLQCDPGQVLSVLKNVC